MLPIEERYSRDSAFRNLVDCMYILLVDLKSTPTEIREAAMLAQIKYEETKIKSISFMDIDDLRSE